MADVDLKMLGERIKKARELNYKVKLDTNGTIYRSTLLLKR